MPWGPPMPLTIAQPRSTHWDEVAWIVGHRKAPLIDTTGSSEFGEYLAAGEAKVKVRHRGPTRPFKQYRSTALPRLRAALKAEGEMTTSAIMERLQLRRAQVGHVLYQAKLAGMVTCQRDPDERTSGSGCAVHENLWRLAANVKGE